MTLAEVRTILRQAAHAYQPLGAYDPALRDRLWAAYDALTVADLQHASTPPISAHPEDDFLSDASAILCRVFDDEPDTLNAEFRAFSVRGQWLSSARLLGAFIRQRLDRANPPGSPDCSETPKGSGNPEVTVCYQNTIESARNDQHDVRSVREDRRDHDRHPARVL